MQLTPHTIYGGTRGYVSADQREQDIKELKKQGYDHFVEYKDTQAPIALSYGVRVKRVCVQQDSKLVALFDVTHNRVNIIEASNASVSVDDKPQTTTDTSLGPQTIHRYPSVDAARMVLKAASSLSEAKLWVRHNPVSEKERERGVGDYEIISDTKHSNVYASHRLSRCVDTGLTLALADALRDYDPQHPLLQIWHLRPENRNKLPKYNT